MKLKYRPTLGIEQDTGEIKFCMNILPTNIFHTSNI